MRKLTDTDPGDMSAAERKSQGLVRLPQCLSDALEYFAKSTVLEQSMGAEFRDAYLMHKRSEISFLEDYTSEARITRYASAY